MHHLANVAWHTAGGTGAPPGDLVLAFALNFSAFTTQALMVDFDQTPRQIGELTGGLLKMLLREAIDAQRAGRGETAVGTGADGGDPPSSPPR